MGRRLSENGYCTVAGVSSDTKGLRLGTPPRLCVHHVGVSPLRQFRQVVC